MLGTTCDVRLSSTFFLAMSPEEVASKPLTLIERYHKTLCTAIVKCELV